MPKPPIPHSLIEKLTDTAAQVSGIPADSLRVKNRTPAHARVRWAIWTALREEGHTFYELGPALDRDHTTIMNGVNRFKKLLGDDALYDVFLACRKVIENHYAEREQKAEERRQAMRVNESGYGAPRSAKAQALLREYEASQKRTRAFMEKPGFARGRDDA